MAAAPVFMHAEARTAYCASMLLIAPDQHNPLLAIFCCIQKMAGFCNAIRTTFMKTLCCYKLLQNNIFSFKGMNTAKVLMTGIYIKQRGKENPDSPGSHEF